jgi:hypothetical protein
MGSWLRPWGRHCWGWTWRRRPSRRPQALIHAVDAAVDQLLLR